MSLFAYRRDRLRFLSELRNHVGDFAPFKLGPKQLYLVSHPDDILWVQTKNAKNYHKATNLGLVLGRGVLTSEGEFWRRHRKLIQPLFHQQHIYSLIPLMNEKIRLCLDGVHDTVKISAVVMKLAYEVVAESLFGTSLNAHFDELHLVMNYLNEFLTQKLHQIIPIPLSFPLPSHLKFVRMKNRLNEIMDQLIEEKKELIKNGKAGKDILSLLISARDDETGEGIDAQQIRDEAITLLLAGHETTGHTLTWIIYVLATQPDIQKKVQAEVDQVLAGQAPGVDHLPRLTYLSQVIDETLRLYPSVWAWTRKSLETDQVHGSTLSPGSILLISPYITHRHPDFWERPNEFNPERFKEPLNEKQKGAYFPFGLGPRQCIGKYFALMEIKLAISQLVQRFSMEATEKAPAILDPRVTMGIKGGLKVNLTPRTKGPLN